MSDILLVADEIGAELSSDGKWLACLSDETGNDEIYVQSFTAEGKLGLISTNSALFGLGAGTAKSCSTLPTME